MKDYNWLMKEMRMLTVVWRAAGDQRSSSIKQRQKIVLRGRPAPPRLGPRPWGGGRGKLARPVQEWEQVVGIHVVQLKNYTLDGCKRLCLLAPHNMYYVLFNSGTCRVQYVKCIMLSYSHSSPRCCPPWWPRGRNSNLPDWNQFWYRWWSLCWFSHCKTWRGVTYRCGITVVLRTHLACRGLLCPCVPGVLGVAGSPGVAGPCGHGSRENI